MPKPCLKERIGYVLEWAVLRLEVDHGLGGVGDCDVLVKHP